MNISIKLFTIAFLSISIFGCASEADTAKKETDAKTESTSIDKNTSNQNNYKQISSTDKSDSEFSSENSDLIEGEMANTTDLESKKSALSEGNEVVSDSEPRFANGGSGGNDDGSSFGAGSGPGLLVEETVSIDIHKYEKLNAFLKKYVSASGKVNYGSIKANKSALDLILKEIEANYIKSNWSSNQKLAYWINVYNIYTIKLVVDNYPTTSITKITAEPWKKKFIKLGGKTLSLAHVENEIIRKKFNEPRIHFALNCASKSCPNLLNAAYTPSNLQSKLTSQTKKFLNDTSKNEFEKKSISISKIFDWYSADFNKSGTTIDFINKYRTEQLKSPKVEYKEYSWDLNN